MPNMITTLLKILIITILLAGCSQETETKYKKRGSRVQLVEAVVVKRVSIGSQQHLSGSLIAKQSVKIFNQESGQIEKLPYFQGDNVNQGDTIVFIRNDKIKAVLNKSKATRRQAEINLNRLSKLIKKNLTSDEELSQAQTALALAKAEESINQIRFNDTFIKAPFTGVISERLSQVSDIVPIHSHILSIIDISKLIIKVQISELLLPQLLLNSRVSIEIDALSTLKNITGKISRIYPTIDPLSRQGTLEVELSNVPTGAKPGQLSRIIIYSPAKERLLVDAAALQYDNTGKYVYRIDTENRITKITVKTGLQVNNKIEIIDGLQENDLVVVEGFSNLENGKKIKLANKSKDTKIKPQLNKKTGNNIN